VLQKKPSYKQDLRSPLVIGGIGGSGTRVIATILEEAGIYVGSYRNPEMDSGFFGRLVASRPSLWKDQSPEIHQRLRLFALLHLGKRLSPGDTVNLLKFAETPKLKMLWLYLRRAYTPEKKRENYRGWGFKHPCTHFYLHQLATQFPAMRYIHVERHGMDMAFSTNTHQLVHWGQDFGIDPNDLTPTARLDFWIRVNTWAEEECRALFPNRHLTISFDALCTDPEREIARLLSFAEVQSGETVSTLAQLVKTPSSIGRYLGKQESFSQEQVQAVRQRGFIVQD
jgi:hypothetical protein